MSKRLPWLPLLTACCCGLGVLVCLLHGSLAAQYLGRSSPFWWGLLAAGPFVVVALLCVLGGRRVAPSWVALLTALAGLGVVGLTLGWASYDIGLALATGRLAYGGGESGTLIIELGAMVITLLEWVVGVPAFLLLYGLGWLVPAWLRGRQTGPSDDPSLGS